MIARMIVLGGLILLILLFVIVVKNPLLMTEKSRPPEGQQANKDLLRQHVEFMAASQPPRNFAHPEALKKVADYIKQKFEDNGFKAEMPSFKIRNNTYYNVVSRPGRPAHPPRDRGT